jgi:prepilin-type N-terminal cleavage/methylation domain-containing protein
VIARFRRDDAGFSLVELIITMGLFAIVLTIVGNVIVSALTADRSVREITGTTTGGQLVVNVVEETVRNSTALRVTTNVDGASTFVAVRTTAGGTARCHAFFFDSSASIVYERTSASAITAPSPGAVGADWTQLSASVNRIVPASGTPTPFFAAQGTRGLAVSFTVDRASGPATLFVTAVTGRAPLSNVSPQCF